MDARKQPKQRRSRELVEALLEGAARVFDREGLDATTNRIAQEAGVSVGSLYQYFPNKEALLTALAHQHMGRVDAALEHTLVHARHAGDLRQGLRMLIVVVAGEHRHHPSTQVLMREFAPRVPALVERFDACRAGVANAFVELVRNTEGRELSVLQARIAVGAADGAVHYTAGDDVPFEVWVDELTDVMLGVLQASPSTRR